MNATAVRFENERLPAFDPIISGQHPALTLVSKDFPPVSTFGYSSYFAGRYITRVSALHRLRLYAGAALLGAVICGLAFGWTEHRDLAQWIGAGVALFAYAVTRWRSSTS